jgi:N-acyl-D-aspartate/D-glutamate deacylase
MSAELVIRGGTVVDGTGAPSVRADVAIANGRVTEIGPNLTGDRILDAGGHVVAPGFVDIHTHYDAQVFWDPALTPSCHHGVTTVVAGNCGFSIAPTRPEHRQLIARTLENVEDMNVASLAAGIPWDFATFPEYLASVERRGVGLNYAAYIGHTALRLFAMGDDAYERAATPDEIARMQAILREALRAGAAGFATSFAITHRGVDGKPVPSRFAQRAELEALLAVMREEQRGAFSIAPGEQCGIADLYELQPKTGVPFTYGALLTFPGGGHKQLVDLNNSGWARGAEVWPQVTPRPLTFAMTLAEPFTLNTNPEFAALMGKPLAARRTAYADAGFRARALEAFRAQRVLSPRFDTFVIDEIPARPELVGRRLAELAAERGASPFDTLLDLALGEPALALRVRAVIANDETSEVGALISDPHCVLGLSDAGAHVGQLCDAPQATDFLGNWVRGRSLMPIEEAVRRLTSVQADLIGLADRGRLRPGAWADLVVFDPATVAPGPVRRVRDFPANAERLTADAPTGVRHVIVNGTPVREEGRHVAGSEKAGRVVRPAPRAEVRARA